MAQLVKNTPAMQETWVQSLDWEEPLEKGIIRLQTSDFYSLFPTENNAAMNIHTCVLMGAIYMFISLEYTSSGRIAKSYGKSVFNF